MVVLFFVFLGFLIAFHVSEFCLAQLYMRDDLSNRSWLISKPYLIAMIAASAEYWLEGALLPGMKAPVGVVLGPIGASWVDQCERKDGQQFVLL